MSTSYCIWVNKPKPIPKVGDILEVTLVRKPHKGADRKVCVIVEAIERAAPETVEPISHPVGRSHNEPADELAYLATRMEKVATYYRGQVLGDTPVEAEEKV